MANGDLHKIAEGREAEIFAWQDGAVLRLLRRTDGQQQVEWEAVAMEAARASGVRVPAVRGTTTALGRPGLIMERIDGPDMLTLIARRPWTVFFVGGVSGGIHAGLHQVRAPEVIPELRARLRSRIESSPLVPRHLAEIALSVLDGLSEGDRLCHGDFHPANIIQTGREHVLIDWTNVARGDPMADFARTMLMLKLGDPPPGSPLLIRVGAPFARRLLIDTYVRAYRRARPLDTALAARWETPVAANRLIENIPGERGKLLRLLDEALASPS